MSAVRVCRLICALAVGWCVLLGSAASQEALAQNGDGPDASANTKAGTSSYGVSGTVVNSVTGEPVRRALVQVAEQNGPAAVTDNTGHFQLEGLKEGQAFVSVMKPGFDMETAQTQMVQVGKDAPAVVLKIAPAAVIAGRVTTLDEQPLEGFQIHIISKRVASGRETWMDIPNQGRTNEDGEYRIPGLSAGTYYVAVEHPQTRMSQRGVANPREEVFAKVFYPGVADLSGATPLELGPGREIEADFVVSAEPLYSVAGEISAPSDVTGLNFTRRVGNDEDFTQFVGAQGGRFEGKVPAGAYEVSGPSSNGLQMSTPGASVVISGDNPDVRIAMEPMTNIPVEFSTETGPAGAERSVRTENDIPGFAISLFSTRSVPGQTNWWTRPTGIMNVTPGVYTLQIDAYTEWWVKSAKRGGIDLLSDDLAVVDGAQAPIEITVRNDGAIVSGTVTPPGNVGVFVVQQRGKKNFVKMAMAEQGNFTIAGVPPGDYDVVAIERGEQIEYMNPEVLNPYLASAEHISVARNGRSTVNLNAVPRGK